MKQGNSSRFAVERIWLLEDIGFMWSINDLNGVSWFDMYEELEQLWYCRRHCNVPQGFSEKLSFGKWVMTQRTQYKCMNQGKSSSIDDPKIPFFRGYMLHVD